MALSAGDEDCTEGLSKAIYDQVSTKDYSTSFYDPSGDWKKFCHAVAIGVVNHIVAENNIAAGTVAAIPTSASGLQRDPASTDDCLGPSVQKFLTVTGSIE